MQFKILILDDEPMVCNSIRRVLESTDKVVLISHNIDEAYEIFANENIDLLLLDYKLGERDGLSILKDIREKYPDLSVIMITAYGNIDIAVKAIKLGAYDFLQKRVDPDFIRLNVQRALDNLRLKKEVEQLKESFFSNKHLPKIIANSPKMKSIISMADEFAKSDSTILINGETGTGKSLVAEYIHRQSLRFSKRFIAINCSAIPSELIESELFGYEKGAFTGASKQGKKGLIEEADGGTLFLDEIGDLSLDVQAKLLHVLEKNELLRVGAVKPITVDVRFIAATNADLDEKVKQKTFRIDLFYRLNVAALHIPPLRERKQDILPLAKIFISRFNAKFHKNVQRISPEVESYLSAAYWQGNVRELRNHIERAMLLKKNSELSLKDFISLDDFKKAGHRDSRPAAMFNFTLNPEDNKNLLHEVQKELIEQALILSEQNKSRAAQILGIPRTSLNSCIKRFMTK